ncbi:MAG: hypothetical protein L0Y50_04805 [Beijerinckiaceae bacterium]|nr:hypothetical protein [Beijerinckiaceae bacterium]MCI0735579.1 hypothetical protein [Beijerinckiaceae bacterium]
MPEPLARSRLREVYGLTSFETAPSGPLSRCPLPLRPLRPQRNLGLSSVQDEAAFHSIALPRSCHNMTGPRGEGQKYLDVPPHQGLGLGEAVCVLKQLREFVDADRDLGMIRPKACLVNGERAPNRQGL